MLCGKNELDLLEKIPYDIHKVVYNDYHLSHNDLFEIEGEP